MDRVFSAIKLVGGLAVVGAASLMQTAILLALLPSRTARIRSCIIYERLVGYSVSWLIGCRISIIGKENLNFRRPAIYVFNHTSIADLFITLRILPFGTVGVMKKEIVRYPFFGQVYLLTGHLRVDRSRQNLAISQMRSLGEFVRDRKLSIIMSAEGTRSKDGRLLPFKKGIAHMAHIAYGRRTRLKSVAELCRSKCFRPWTLQTGRLMSQTQPLRKSAPHSSITFHTTSCRWSRQNLKRRRELLTAAGARNVARKGLNNLCFPANKEPILQSESSGRRRAALRAD